MEILEIKNKTNKFTGGISSRSEIVKEKSTLEEKQFNRGNKIFKYLQRSVRNYEYMHRGLLEEDKDKMGEKYLKKRIA